MHWDHEPDQCAPASPTSESLRPSEGLAQRETAPIDQQNSYTPLKNFFFTAITIFAVLDKKTGGFYV
jgi:hypothetical protein